MSAGNSKSFGTGAFTLIELSIVLVIIGLAVGGALVGQDLIRAAYVRAQISQIEKFNTAANTFYGKYGYLPGDLGAGTATTLGFTPRLGCRGNGDGNGLIEWGNGVCPSDPSFYGVYGLGQLNGEKSLFWIDLTTANGQNLNFIEGSFSLVNAGGADMSGNGIGLFLPEAKIKTGNGAYVSVMSWNGSNYFVVSSITKISQPGGVSGYPALSVAQAYAIDRKLDEGLPQSGIVQAQYEADPCCWVSPAWAAGNTSALGPYGAFDPTTIGPVVAGDGVVTPGSATTCYDNAGVSGGVEQYSMGQSGGAGFNCALTFRFQ